MLGGRKLEIAAAKGSGLDKFDVSFFTASCDTVKTNTRYAKELKLDYPILSDPEKNVAKSYGVVHDKRTVPERWTFYVGKDGTIKHIEKQVNAGKHAGQIVNTLKKLGVAQR